MDEYRKPNVQEIWWIFNNPPEGKSFINKEQDTSAFLLGFLQECHPCPDSVFRNDFILVREAFLVYHNIDPVSFEPLFVLPHIYDQIIQILDEFKGIRLFRALKNRFGSSDVRISLDDFIAFLRVKGFPIPEHFKAFPDMEPLASPQAPVNQTLLLSPEAESQSEITEENGSTKAGNCTGKEFVKSFDYTTFNKNELLMMGGKLLAAAMWKEDRSQSVTHLQNNVEAHDILVKLAAFLCVENPEEKEIKHEWVSPFRPKEATKRGRAKKINRRIKQI